MSCIPFIFLRLLNFNSKKGKKVKKQDKNVRDDKKVFSIVSKCYDFFKSRRYESFKVESVCVS